MVQSLVLTRHVLFVGVSMQDDNVLRLVYEVSLSRRRRDLPEHWGTVVHFGSAPEKEALYGHELDWVTVDGPDAAREIDILLDAVAAYGSDDVPWLLDSYYAAMLDDEERLVVNGLLDIAASADRLASRDAHRWGPVVAALRASGWRGRARG